MYSWCQENSDNHHSVFLTEIIFCSTLVLMDLWRCTLRDLFLAILPPSRHKPSRCRSEIGQFQRGNLYFTLWLTLNEHEIYILSINFCENEKSVKRSVAITVASTRESGCARCEHGEQGCSLDNQLWHAYLRSFVLIFLFYFCNQLNLDLILCFFQSLTPWRRGEEPGLPSTCTSTMAMTENQKVSPRS